MSSTRRRRRTTTSSCAARRIGSTRRCWASGSRPWQGLSSLSVSPRCVSGGLEGRAHPASTDSCCSGTLHAGHHGPAAHRQPAVHGRLGAHCTRQLRPLLGVDWTPHDQHHEAQCVGPGELACDRHGPRPRPRVAHCDRERPRGVGEWDIPAGSGDPLCRGRPCWLRRVLSRVG